MALFFLVSCSGTDPITPKEQAHPTMHPEHKQQETCELCRTFDQTKRGVVMFRSEGRIGSGVMISNHGLIVTAAHVVPEDQDQLSLILYNRNQKTARLIHRSNKFNLAVLRFKDVPDRIRPVDLSEMPEVVNGQPVTAIGHPYKLGWTITQGIISGVRKKGKLLQTDAGVSPGNSGGPLLNEDGQLIGIILAEVQEDRASNIAFARPVTVVKKYLAKNQEKMKRATKEAGDPEDPPYS